MHQHSEYDRFDNVVAPLNFYVDDGTTPVNYLTEDGLKRQGEYQSHKVRISNGRITRDSIFLDEQGFELWDHKTKVTDFFDKRQVDEVYSSEVADLVKQATGCYQTFVINHAVRLENTQERESRKTRGPVQFVHNDFTEESGRRLVRKSLPDIAESLLNGRCAVIQVWRSIADPISTTPLALCDARTIVPSQLITAERRSKDRVGHIQCMTYSKSNRWYYFPDLQRDEALLIKTFESDQANHGGVSPHSAFSNPAASVKAPPRQSIESRVFAFFR